MRTRPLGFSSPDSVTALGILLATFLAAAMPAQEIPAHRRLDPAITARIRAATGHDPFAMFAALARGELAPGMERFFADRPATLDRDFAAAAVCAIWSADPDVAFGAACRVGERSLDLADIDRYLDTVEPHVFDATQRYDFDTFKHVIDTRRLDRLLASPPPVNADVRYGYLANLHRSLRPSHVANLRDLARGRDPVQRREAFELLGTLSTHSPAYPELLMPLLIEWPGQSALEIVDDEDLDANPPYIARAVALPSSSGFHSFDPLLERWFAPDANPSREARAFAPFLARLVADCRPRAGDADRVERALRQDVAVIRLGVLASLANAADVGAFRPVLDAFVRRTDVDDVEVAWAHRLLGDVETLRERAVDEPAFLLAALQAGDDAAWHDWAARAFGDDAEASGTAIRMLAEAAALAPFAPAPFPDRARRRLREAIGTGAEVLDLDRIETLAAEFPTARGPSLVRRALQRIATADEPLGDETAAMLEVADPARITAALQHRIERTGGAHGDRRILGLLGPTGGDIDEWLTWSDDQGGLLAIRWAPETEFGRRFGERVAARFRDRSHADADLSAFASFASAHGLPESVAEAWLDALRATPDEVMAAGWPRWRDAVSTGRPVDALDDFLDTPDDSLAHRWVEGLGEVRDERIVDRLRRWRFTPGEPIQDLILELAVAGDPDALAEFDAVLRRHLYGWIDDAADNRRVLVDDLALLPYWIDELGTICCRRNGAAVAIETLVGVDPVNHPENFLVTQRDATHAWYARARDRLRWSEVLGRYTVMPE